MFKRTSLDGNHKDEFIDIGERLAPFVQASLGPDQRELVVAVPGAQPAQPGGVASRVAPLHGAKEPIA